MGRRLYVGRASKLCGTGRVSLTRPPTDLAPDATVGEVIRSFERFGKIADCRMLVGKLVFLAQHMRFVWLTMAFGGFGFVEFGDARVSASGLLSLVSGL